MDPTAGHVGDPAVRHIVDPAVRHVGDPSLRHVGDLAVRHVGDPAVRHVGDPAARHVGDPAVRHVGDPAVRHGGDPAVRHVGDPAVRHGGHPAVRHGGDPAFRGAKKINVASRFLMGKQYHARDLTAISPTSSNSLGASTLCSQAEDLEKRKVAEGGVAGIDKSNLMVQVAMSPGKDKSINSQDFSNHGAITYGDIKLMQAITTADFVREEDLNNIDYYDIIKTVDINDDVIHEDINQEVVHMDINQEVIRDDINQEVIHDDINQEVICDDINQEVICDDINHEAVCDDINHEAVHMDINHEAVHMDINQEVVHMDMCNENDCFMSYQETNELNNEQSQGVDETVNKRVNESDNSLDNIDLIKTEITSQTNENIGFKCIEPLCKFETKYKRNFNNHVKNHEKQKIFVNECTFCFQRFKTKSHANDHMKRIHQAPIPIKLLCENCGTLYRNCADKKHECDHINGTNVKKSKVTHTKSKLYSCTICEYKSELLFNLHRHVESVHKKDYSDIVYCRVDESCSFKTVRNDKLLRHEETHNEISLKILKTKSVKKMKSHLNINSKNKNKICYICGSIVINEKSHLFSTNVKIVKKSF